MKKLLVVLAILLFSKSAQAIMPEEFNFVPHTSYTEVATPGTILFTSATINWVGITIDSPSALGTGGLIAIQRSTSATFTPNLITTMTKIITDLTMTQTYPAFIPLFELQNTSYTYLTKVGIASVNYWFRCLERDRHPTPINGLCPGVDPSSQK